MKEVFIFNRFGIDEVFKKEEVGVEFVKEEEWEEIKVSSNILKEYKIYDGVVRVKVEERYSDEEVLEEIDSIEWERFEK